MSASLGTADPDSSEMIALGNVVKLDIGDSFQPRLGKDRILYAGMPSETVYSIVQLRWEFFYRGYAWNLFFPKEQTRIRVNGIEYEVQAVGPDTITLRW
jgi:hypothetical protein